MLMLRELIYTQGMLLYRSGDADNALVVGRQGPIQGNTEALATVTGIVDGTGSFGAAIGQVGVYIACVLKMM